MSRVLAPLMLVVLAGTACGNPRDATPLPEPPGLDLDRIGPAAAPTEYRPDVYPIPIHMAGEPGSAPAGALIQVTNLELPDPPSVATVAANGSFAVSLMGGSGDELRFQLVVDGQRGAPLDAFYVDPSTPGAQNYLTPSMRHDCLSLSPGFEVTFENMGVAGLVLDNGCDGGVTIGNARSRSGASTSRVSNPLPVVLAAGETASLSLEFAGSAFQSSEDTLFVDATLGGRAIRYPITLFAP